MPIPKSDLDLGNSYNPPRTPSRIQWPSWWGRVQDSKIRAITPITPPKVAGPPPPPKKTTFGSPPVSPPPFWKAENFGSVLTSLHGPKIQPIPAAAPVQFQEDSKIREPLPKGYRAPLTIEEFDRKHATPLGRGSGPKGVGGSPLPEPLQGPGPNRGIYLNDREQIIGNAHTVYIYAADEENHTAGELRPYTTQAGTKESDLALTNAMRQQGKSDLQIDTAIFLKNISLNISSNYIFLAMGPVEVEWAFNTRNPTPAGAVLASVLNIGLYVGESIGNNLEVDWPIRRNTETGKLMFQRPIRFETQQQLNTRRKALQDIIDGKEQFVITGVGAPSMLDVTQAKAALNLLDIQQKKKDIDYQRLQDAREAVKATFQIGVDAFYSAAQRAQESAAKAKAAAPFTLESRIPVYTLFKETVKEIFIPHHITDPEEIKSRQESADLLRKASNHNIDIVNKGTKMVPVQVATYGTFTMDDLNKEYKSKNGLTVAGNAVQNATNTIILDTTPQPTEEEIKKAMEEYKKSGVTLEYDEVANLLYQARIKEPTLKQISAKLDELYGTSGTNLERMADSMVASSMTVADYVVTDKMVQEERMNRLRTRGNTLSLAAEDIKKDLEEKGMVEVPLTPEEAKIYSLKAISDMKLAQEKTFSLEDHDPTFAATWSREPWRKELFLNALAMFEIQAGRMPNNAEIRDMKQMYSNAGTEMLAESIVDITNFVPGLEAVDALIPGMKAGRELFQESLKLGSLKVIRKTPVVGWFFREAKMSIATKTADMMNKAINNIIKVELSNDAMVELLPKLGASLVETIGKSDAEKRILYNALTQEGNPKYMEGVVNISFQEFKRLGDLAAESSGGISPAKWGDMWKTAQTKSVAEASARVERSIRRANKDLPADQLDAIIKREISNISTDPRKNTDIAARFAGEFKESFLDQHRVFIDASGKKSSMLEDTLFGQMVQKIYLMGDSVENVPAFKRLQKAMDDVDAWKHMKETYDIDKKGLTYEQQRVMWKELKESTEKKSLSFGETVNALIVNASKDYGSNAKKFYTELGDALDLIHQYAQHMYNIWAMSVLSLNPRWFIQNLLDTSGRSMIFGGNPLEDLSMLTFGTHKVLADKLGEIPIELGQNLARSGVDSAYTVSSRFLYEDFKPGVFGAYTYWKYEKDRLMEVGIKNSDEVQAVVAKLFGRNLDTSSPFVQALHRLKTGFTAGIAAIPGAASDFNTAIEFTVRLRMFSREYFRLMEEFGPQFKNMNTEQLNPLVRKLAFQIWDASGYNPAKMRSLVDNLVDDVVEVGGKKIKLTEMEMKQRSWSLLFGTNVDKALGDLTTQEKHVFLADIEDRFTAYVDSIQKSGKNVTEGDINKFVDDLSNGMKNEIQERISKASDSLKRNIDGTGAPDVLHKPSTLEEVANMKAGMIPTSSGKPVTPPTRKTPNRSIKDMVDKINTFFSKPAAPAEATAARQLKHKTRPAKSIVESFSKAMEPYGAVKMVPGDKVIVSMVNGEVAVSIGEGIMSQNRKAVIDALTEATIKTKGLYDRPMLDSVKLTEDAYVQAFNVFMDHNGPTNLLLKDKNSFLIIAGQMVQDPHFRTILESLKGHPFSFEGTRILEKSGINIYDLIGDDWKAAVSILEHQYAAAPMATQIAGNNKALSTLKLREYIIKDKFNDPELVREVESYLNRHFVAEGQLSRFLYSNYPGPFKARALGPKQKDKIWKIFWEIKGEIYTRQVEQEAKFLKALESGNPEEAKRLIQEYNLNFVDNYLNTVGFNVTKNIDGGVEQFSFKIGDNSIIRGRPTTSNPMDAKWDTKQLYESFYAPAARRSFEIDNTIMIDANALLQPGKSAVDQISRAMVNSFDLTVPQAHAYARTINEHVNMMAARSGQPVEELLGRLGFARMEGHMTLTDGLELARSRVTDSTGRFVFYGFGQQNFRAMVTQMSEMHYSDLVYLARNGDSVAVQDLRAIKNMITKISGEVVPEGALGEKLTRTQSELFSDVFTKWIENGVTENPKLKAAFGRFRNDYISKPYQNLIADNVLNDAVDIDMFALLEKSFMGTNMDDIPTANSFAIRSMANRAGLGNDESELLKLINNSLPVTGMNDKASFIQQSAKLFTDQEHAEKIYSLVKAMSEALDMDMSSIHFLHPDGEIDPSALFTALKKNRLLQGSLDEDMVDRMVESAIRYDQKLVANQLPSNLESAMRHFLDDATSNDEMRLIVRRVKEYDSDLAAKLYREYNSAGKMYQIDQRSVDAHIDAIYRADKHLTDNKLPSQLTAELRSAMDNAMSNEERTAIINSIRSHNMMLAMKMGGEYRKAGKMLQSEADDILYRMMNPEMSRQLVDSIIKANKSNPIPELRRMFQSSISTEEQLNILDAMSPEHIERMLREEDLSDAEKLTAMVGLDAKDTNLAQKLYQDLRISGKMKQEGEQASGPLFFLKSKVLVNTKFKGTMSMEDARRFLLNNGVSNNEMKWSGLEDFLTPRKMPSLADYKSGGIGEFPGEDGVIRKLELFSADADSPFFYFDGNQFFYPWVPNKKYNTLKEAVNDLARPRVTKEDMLAAIDKYNFRIWNEIEARVSHGFMYPGLKAADYKYVMPDGMVPEMFGKPLDDVLTLTTDGFWGPNYVSKQNPNLVVLGSIPGAGVGGSDKWVVAGSDGGQFFDTAEDAWKSITADEFGSYVAENGAPEITKNWQGKYVISGWGGIGANGDQQGFNTFEEAVDEVANYQLVSRPTYEKMNLFGGTGYKETRVRSPQSEYSTGHFGGVNNYTYHIRTEDVDTTRVLLELQSDAASDAAKVARDRLKYEAEKGISDDGRKMWGIYEKGHVGDMEYFKFAVEDDLAKTGQEAINNFFRPVSVPLTDEYVDHGIKNAIQQAVQDGKKSLAVPTTPEQIMKIEHWGLEDQSFETMLAQVAMVDPDKPKDLEAVVNFYVNIMPKKMEKFVNKYGGTLTQKELNGQLMNVIEFSDDLIKTASTVGFPMFQKGAKATTTKGAWWKNAGQNFIALFKTADATTAAHEIGHMGLGRLIELDDDRLRVVEKFAGVEQGSLPKLKEAWDTHSFGQETLRTNKFLLDDERKKLVAELELIREDAQKYVDLHEKFSNGFLTYLKNGNAPTPALKEVFEYFKKILADIWTAAKKEFVEIDDDMIKVYDSLLFDSKIKLDIPKRYASLGEVPVEIAQSALKGVSDVNYAKELNGAFDVWKLRRGLGSYPSEATASYDIFKQFLKGKIDNATGEIEYEYRSIMWELEQLNQAVTSYHYGDALMTHMFPPVPERMMGDSVKTLIAHNRDNMRVLDSMLNGVEAMRADWIKRANGGNIIEQLTVEEKNALRDWATVAARNKSDFHNLIVNGGVVEDAAGKVIANADGALKKTNKVLLDYNTRTNFDQTMKMLFPFWMFPSRSLPFWAETLVTHPQVTSLYFKIQRASESQRYQAGAIDSRGRPLSSMAGYIKLPNSDIWVNPLAPFSFRYILDIFKYIGREDYVQTGTTEDTLTGLPYLVKEFMQNSPIIGFNLAPWVGYFLKRQLDIPDSLMPGWALVPQLNLIPKWAIHPWMEGIKPQGAQDFVTYWMFPEPNWQDSLIEKRILENFHGKSEAMSKPEFDVYRQQVVDAIKDKGTNQLWLDTYKEVTQEDATRNFAAFFTGVYGKTFTDGAADLISLKTYNNSMNHAMNDDFLASMMSIPVDDQERWDLRQLNRVADTADGWSSRLYKDISWVKNEDGKVETDPKKRASLLANQIDLTERSRQAYFDYKAARARLDANLATLTRIGSPSDATRKYYLEYYAEIHAIEARSPEWSGYMGSAKPASLIMEDLENAWWRMIRTTMPIYDVTREEYKDYEERVAQWKKELPEHGQYMMTYPSFFQQYAGTMKALNEDQKKGIGDKFLKQLMSETNEDGYNKYRLKNDTVYDAANEAYRRFYWNKFWDSIEGLEGAKREKAMLDFNEQNPTPGEKQMYEWIKDIYGPTRFSMGQVMTLMGASPDQVMTTKERLDYGKTPEQLAQNQIWDILAWAGPSTKRNLLTNAYLSITPEHAEDFDTWYNTGGYGFINKPEDLMRFRDNLVLAANRIGLQPPTGEELDQRIRAEDLNDQFKKLVAEDPKLGPTFLQQPDVKNGIPAGIYAQYAGLGEDYYMQKEWLKQNPPSVGTAIKYYKALRKSYSQQYPLWGSYYQDYVPLKKQNIKFNAVTPTTTSTSTPAPQPPPAAPGTVVPNIQQSNISNTGMVPVQKGNTPIPRAITFPSGFEKVAGAEIVQEIEQYAANRTPLSQPAKNYLYDLAKRRRQYRAFIYGILSE